MVSRVLTYFPGLYARSVGSVPVRRRLHSLLHPLLLLLLPLLELLSLLLVPLLDLLLAGFVRIALRQLLVVLVLLLLQLLPFLVLLGLQLLLLLLILPVLLRIAGVGRLGRLAVRKIIRVQYRVGLRTVIVGTGVVGPSVGRALRLCATVALGVIRRTGFPRSNRLATA